MTNLELYKMLNEQLLNQETILDRLEQVLALQEGEVEDTRYEVSEAKSKLTEEELDSLEVF